jgi:hypothetical protein
MYKKLITIYTLSYFTITTIFVYLLNLPQLITNDKEGLIKEYYKDNFVNVIIFDYFLIMFYLLFNQLFIKLFNIQSTIGQIIINILGTIFISGSFMIYFLNKPYNKNSFFSKWFYSVKWKAVLYDIILILLCFMLIKIFYQLLNKN